MCLSMDCGFVDVGAAGYVRYTCVCIRGLAFTSEGEVPNMSVKAESIFYDTPLSRAKVFYDPPPAWVENFCDPPPFHLQRLKTNYSSITYCLHECFIHSNI